MKRARAFVCVWLALHISACATTNNAPVVDRSSTMLTPAAEVPPVEAEHIVAPGDTLYGIAFRHGLDYRRLAAWNAIAPPYLIRPGQHLRLGPPPGSGPDFSDVATAPARDVRDDLSEGVATTQPAPDFSDVAHGQVDNAQPSTVTSAAPPAPSAAGPVGTFAAQETETPVVVDTLGDAPVPPAAVRPAIAPTPTPRPSSVTTTAPATPAPRVPAPAPPVAAPTAPTAPSTPPSNSAAPVSASVAPGQVLPTGPTRAVAGITWSWPARGPVVGRFISGDAARQGIDIAGTVGAPVQAAAAGEVVYSGNGLIGYGELVIIKHSAEFLSAYGHNSRRLVKEGDRVKAGQVIAEMGRSAAAQDMLHFEVRRGGRPSDPLQFLPPR